MENTKGTFDGMEINGHQVLTIDELPTNLYDKLLGNCDINNVPQEVMKFIEKIEKKTKIVCDNLIENYKIIPIDKDGNCFFQAVANALNIPMQKVREQMAKQLTQPLVDVRNEFETTNKTLKQYEDDLLKNNTFVSDYDVEQLFPIAFPGIGLIILNINDNSSGCDITCSSNLLENKNRYIILLLQHDLNGDAHYDLISIDSKLVLPRGELSDKLVKHVHNQCKTIHLDKENEKTVEEIHPILSNQDKANPIGKEKPVNIDTIPSNQDKANPIGKEKPVNIDTILSNQDKANPIGKEKPVNIDTIQDKANPIGKEKPINIDTAIKKDEIKQMLKNKGYTGLLPKYKNELIDIYNKLYAESPKKTNDVDEPMKPLEKMTLQEIQTELQKKNITKYLPRTKTELIKLYNADRCDPLNDTWCSDDKICDLRNNVCMDKSDIKPTKNTSILFETMNDHQIAGTSANLFQLKHAIKNKKTTEPISLTIPQSVENGVIKVASISELKQQLLDIVHQNTFYKLISELV